MALPDANFSIPENLVPNTAAVMVWTVTTSQVFDKKNPGQTVGRGWWIDSDTMPYQHYHREGVVMAADDINIDVEALKQISEALQMLSSDV